MSEPKPHDPFLRDIFAGQVLQGMYASNIIEVGRSVMPDLPLKEHCEAAAEWCYLQADAMLKARSK